MVLNVEQTVLEYLEKYGFLFESDSSILRENIKTKDELIRIKLKFDKEREKIKKEHQSALDKLKDFSKEVGVKYRADLVDKFEDQIKSQTEKVRALRFLKLKEINQAEVVELAKLSRKTGALLTGVGLASLIIYAGFKNYMLNRKIAKFRCKGLEGVRKRKCIRSEKERMLHQRVLFLKNSIQKCKNSKDPIKCKIKMDQEVLRLEGKLKAYLLDVRKQAIGR